MKIIFLDVDGVLNSIAWMRVMPRGEVTQAERDAVSPFAAEPGPEEPPDRHARNARWFDPRAVACLNRLVAESGADVVISSTWRIGHSLAEIDTALRFRGFQGRVIGATPFLQGEPRGLEIQAWMDAQPEPPEAFVILDDSSDMEHLLPKLVRTQGSVGLTEVDVDFALFELEN